MMKYALAVCLIIILLIIVIVMSRSDHYTQKSVIRSVQTIHYYDLKIGVSYNIPQSYLTIELLETNTTEGKCRLEIANALEGTKAMFWVLHDRASPEINDIIGAKADVIVVTLIKDDWVRVSVRGGFVE